MVRLFWVFFFLGFGLAVSAQDDPVLMYQWKGGPPF